MGTGLEIARFLKRGISVVLLLGCCLGPVLRLYVLPPHYLGAIDPKVNDGDLAISTNQ